MVRRLLYLNGIATLFVVINHASGWGFISMFWWTHRYRDVAVPNFDQMGSVSYFALRAIEQIVIFAIPAFLFVSGFFVAFATGRGQKTIGWKFVFTRVIQLSIPFLIWSVVILGLEVLQGRALTMIEFLNIVLTGQAADPFYYIPVLIQLYLLSPFFIVPLAKANWKLLLVITGLLLLFIKILNYISILGLEIPWLEPFLFLTRSVLFPSLIFWFALGVVIGFQGQILKVFIARMKWFWLVAIPVLFVLGMIEWELLLDLSGQSWIAPATTLIDSFFVGACLLAYLAFDQVPLPVSKKLGNLGTKSYGVYLVHAPVLTYTSRIIYHFTPGILGIPLLLVAILVVVGLAIPLAMMDFVNRSPLRRIYSYLFG